jgi:pimeloyl-ACP methyl ester carboxylesterase
MPIAELNGVELYYETTGTGERLVLTHGSWTDGSGWAPAVGALGERFEVVTWDRRGHSRSRTGPGPGSRDEDAADLATLVEHLGGPVHLVGSSYGSVVVLTLVARRPDLAASAVAHEPPLLDLLAGTTDPATAGAITAVEREIASVLALIDAGEPRRAAEQFIDHVAVGPGTWDRFPKPWQATLERNAPTFLDEQRDPTSRSIDAAALAAAAVPLMLTYGTEGPEWYRAVIAELSRLVPAARVEAIAGAGHVPHLTHTERWVATVLAFHEQLAPATPEEAR